MPRKLTHVDAAGKARMVDVSGKAATEREAVAKGTVTMQPETLQLIREGNVAKGDVLAVAQVAGIMAAKETHRLIPMCHPLPISQVKVEFQFGDEPARVDITATVKTVAQTGVEME
ncbi:MAG: cyclic pyranopterin monophosphate synthase MoaC, partial [Chloroflexi bacterium]|nr:cyclic pyranopterin monophosphate synthase MoaC [Chloroflexota bacterium]